MKGAGAASGPYSSRVLAWICAGHTLSHFWMLTLPPLFPALAAEFDITFAQLGLLITFYSLTNGICQVPSGYLVDRYGAKPTDLANNRATPVWSEGWQKQLHS